MHSTCTNSIVRISVVVIVHLYALQNCIYNCCSIVYTGVMNYPRTCLHSVLSLIEPTGNYNSMACHHSDPKLATLCYQLIYLLCSNKFLSAPTLRYLRSNHNFFYVQVVELPMMKQQGFVHGEELYSSSELALVRQLSWLLKSVAVELRMTAVLRQRSYFQGLVDVLVSESPTLESSAYQSGIIHAHQCGSFRRGDKWISDL